VKSCIFKTIVCQGTLNIHVVPVVVTSVTLAGFTIHECTTVCVVIAQKKRINGGLKAIDGYEFNISDMISVNHLK